MRINQQWKEKSFAFKNTLQAHTLSGARQGCFPINSAIDYFQLTVLMSIIFRGHTVRAVSESFQQAKDAGFKVVSHMMPDLPNVDFERDVEQFIVRERKPLFSILPFFVQDMRKAHFPFRSLEFMGKRDFLWFSRLRFRFEPRSLRLPSCRNLAFVVGGGAYCVSLVRRLL